MCGTRRNLEAYLEERAQLRDCEYRTLSDPLGLVVYMRSLRNEDPVLRAESYDKIRLY